MGLTSSLFSGVSGLSTLGNAMTVIGDNIANVNTVGFKSSRVVFQDILSQAVATQSGTAQVGRGTALADVTAAFDQGSFESTESATDLAIGGDGFFVVRHPDDTNNKFYTRAGSFRFDKEGNFTNPAGYVVNGWVLRRNDTTGDVEDVGTITDIKLQGFTSPPEPTDSVTLITNLDSDGKDNTTAVAGGLVAAWDGTASPPMADTAYEYQSTLKVYDSLGDTHDVTIYYDVADSSLRTYEFVITGNPSEDFRSDGAGGTVAETLGGGLFGKGELTFSQAGKLTDITFSSFDGVGDPADPADFTAVALGAADPYFTFTPDFLGATPQEIELNFGASWNGTNFVSDSLATTMFATASTTIFQSSTGYGAGDLQSISVDADGVITGQYSNGQVTPLFRVALAKFQNTQGLFKEGGNLFRETRTSGPAITNKPGTAGLGSIASNSLEQSNVDISNEFVKMITTQRGFQANSKIVTTVDTMLSDVINMKR
ncbi:MAG: flagellar hook protein FlgE [Desulfobacterales bacterium]|nr:flagellar hook protein FlgE [Desulfobacterales bacterium]